MRHDQLLTQQGVLRQKLGTTANQIHCQPTRKRRASRIRSSYPEALAMAFIASTPIVEVTSYRGYTKGFLETCWLDHACTDFTPAVGHHAWATVRELGLSYADSGAALVLHPCMRALRRIHSFGTGALVRLARHESALPVEELGVDLMRMRIADQVDLLGSGPGLPAVKSLGVSSAFAPSDLAWLDGTRFGQRLERLRVSSWAKALVAWMDWLNASSIGAVLDTGYALLQRDAEGLRSILRVYREPQAVSVDDVHVLRRLADDALTELDFDGLPEAARQKYRAVGERQRRLVRPVR
jgi:hypothetical protein